MKRSLVAALLLFTASPAMAQVVPSTYENTPGTGIFVGPHATGARTYQLLMHEDILTDLVGRAITGISFRTATNASSDWPAVDVTYSNYDIYLSQSVAPADRSLTFADNVVGIQTQVRSGPLTVNAGDYPMGGSPTTFGPPINVSDWAYTGGHLLVEIRHDGNGVSSRSMDALVSSTPGYGTMFSGAWQSSYNATTGLQGNFSVIKFSSVAVPAPGALALFAGAFVAPGRRRR